MGRILHRRATTPESTFEAIRHQPEDRRKVEEADVGC